MKKYIFCFFLLFLFFNFDCYSCDEFDYIVYDKNTDKIIFEYAKNIKYLKETDDYEMDIYMDEIRGYIRVKGSNFRIIGPEGEINFKNEK